MTNELILVNENDDVLGTESKNSCHQGDGKKHRAISALIFNDYQEVLVQRRSNHKILWPGSYDVSCATHVFPEETYQIAGERRLPQELGFYSRLELLSKFDYIHKYNPYYSENEMCALLIGKYNGNIKPNKQEVTEFKWMSLDKLKEDISANPNKYTPWLKLSLENLYANKKKADSILEDLCLFEEKIHKPKIGTNLKSDYYSMLTKIGGVVDDCTKEFYQQEIFKRFPEKERLYEKMLERKRGAQKLRAMAGYLAFLAFNDEKMINKEQVKRIITAIELENWSNYELNWIFDKKRSTKSRLEIKEAGLASHGFFNDALRLVWDMPQVAKTLLDINDRVHRGWTPEMYSLTFNSNVMQDFEKFWQAYQIRNIEAGGQFYANYVKLACSYSGKDNAKLHKQLGKIYQEFGEYIQIINDMGDFAFKPVTSDKFVNEKNGVDQFSDLRNGLVTWPIWLMYNRSNQEDRKFMESVPYQELNIHDLKKLSNLFYSTKTYDTLYCIMNKKRLRLGRDIHALDIEPKTRGLINCMVSMISSNRITHTLNPKI
ncbi:MAG: isopentenyl-diphosphate Delta-isomerase [Candidatus Nanoarchaeia archaeon]